MTSARALVETLRSSATPDAELVRRYVDSGDADAFAALVLRHGGLVWRVCRAVAGNPHDADDAYQATFLLFARDAGRIRQPARVAAWLHGVAVKVAGKARSRRRPEPLLFDPVARPETDDDTAAALHAELARLPDKYRVPLVLCGLEGRSRAAVAADLGWTLNRLKSCLEQGRDRLRKRLAARGIVGVGLVAVAPLWAAPPVSVDRPTTDGIASLLTEVSAMTSSRIGRSVVVLAAPAAGVFGLAVGVGGQPPAVPKAEAKGKADPKPPATPVPTWERTDLEPVPYITSGVPDRDLLNSFNGGEAVQDYFWWRGEYAAGRRPWNREVPRAEFDRLLAANPWPLEDSARFRAKGELVTVTANGIGPPEKPTGRGHYLFTWRDKPKRDINESWTLVKVEFASTEQMKPLLAKFNTASATAKYRGGKSGGAGGCGCDRNSVPDQQDSGRTYQHPVTTIPEARQGCPLQVARRGAEAVPRHAGDGEAARRAREQQRRQAVVRGAGWRHPRGPDLPAGQVPRAGRRDGGRSRRRRVRPQGFLPRLATGVGRMADAGASRRPAAEYLSG